VDLFFLNELRKLRISNRRFFIVYFLHCVKRIEFRSGFSGLNVFVKLIHTCRRPRDKLEDKFWKKKDFSWQVSFISSIYTFIETLLSKHFLICKQIQRNEKQTIVFKKNRCFIQHIKKLTTIKRNKLEVVFFHYISVLNCLSWNEQKTDDRIGIQAPQTAIEQTSNWKRYLGNQNSYILYLKARFHLKQFYFL
jgi:hypothetical protein